MMARIWSNNTSIDNMGSVREILNDVPSVKKSIPQDAYKDLYCCMYFVDNWEADSDSKLDEYLTNPKVESVDTTASHQTEFTLVEDGFNSWWQEIVNFEKWLTMDES